MDKWFEYSSKEHIQITNKRNEKMLNIFTY